uniref:Uncharacterized protein n=1 Tax=Eutreptiella gymnastica TaxID=73025 RepID=A0A7S1JGI9_9EUGL
MTQPPPSKKRMTTTRQMSNCLLVTQETMRCLRQLECEYAEGTKQAAITVLLRVQEVARQAMADPDFRLWLEQAIAGPPISSCSVADRCNMQLQALVAPDGELYLPYCLLSQQAIPHEDVWWKLLLECLTKCAECYYYDQLSAAWNSWEATRDALQTSDALRTKLDDHATLCTIVGAYLYRLPALRSKTQLVSQACCRCLGQWWDGSKNKERQAEEVIKVSLQMVENNGPWSVWIRLCG